MTQATIAPKNNAKPHVQDPAGGLAMRFVDMRSAAGTRRCPGAVQTDVGGQFPIRAAPVSDPRVDSEEVRVVTRHPRGLPSGNRPQLPAVDIEVLPAPPIPRESLGRLRPAASCAEGMPARRVFAAAQVRFDSGKAAQQRASDFSTQDSDFRIIQNRAGIPGQLLRKSDMRRWRPATVHDIFASIFMPTTVHIPDPLLKSVDRRAKALGISRNRLVVRALEQAVSVREDWSPEFLQRLRTVDPETSTAVDDLRTAVTQARRSKEPRDL